MGASPPDWVEVSDRADLESKLPDISPPFTVRFQRANQQSVEQFADVQTDRGAEIAELHFDDGRYVTVNVVRELEAIR